MTDTDIQAGPDGDTDTGGTAAFVGLDEELAALDAALDRFDEGGGRNVAVVSDPFGGRENLLDYATQRFGHTATRVNLSTSTADGGVLAGVTTPVAVVDDCHHLFTRRIGGFDSLDRFLADVAHFDGLVVTSWNRFAWDYLDPVRRVGQSFPEQVRVTGLSTEEVTTLLTAEAGASMPTFVDTSPENRATLVETTDVEVSLWGDRRVTLPAPRVNLDYVRHRLGKNERDDVEGVVFERLKRLSDGNPGVARAIWAQTVSDGTLRLDDLTDPAESFDLDDTTSFLLSLVLTNERVDRETLETVVDDTGFDRRLRRLVDLEAVAVDGDQVVLDPLGLNHGVDYLRRRRVLW